ncbi:MAG: outer membrane protein assembly factor BamB family protein [Candidatus Poseidoniales archaeon]
MRMKLYFIIATLLISTIPLASSSSKEQIIIDLDRGIISTAPVISGDILLVKSSGWLSALDLDSGEELWAVEHQTPHFFETSPPLVIEEKVVTGWADGVITAYDLENGSEIWSLETGMKGYGITGSLLLEGDTVLVPTDHGVLSLYHSNGSIGWNASTEETTFYRSSPLRFGNDVLLGGEDGRVFVINESGNNYWLDAPSSISNPSIRGKIVSIGQRLLIPIQSGSGGGLVEVYENQSIIHPISGSLAILSELDGFIIMASTEKTVLFDCISWCVEVQELTNEPISGETQFLENEIILPVNSAEGKWLLFRPSCQGGNCTWELAETIVPKHPQYLTANLVRTDNAIIIVNDAGWVEIRIKQQLEDNSGDEDYDFLQIPWWFLLISGAILILLGVTNKEYMKYGITVGSSLIFMALILNIQSIDDALTSIQKPQEETLDDSIPSQWIGTQIVVFELNQLIPEEFVNMNTWINADGTILKQEEGGGAIYVGGMKDHQNARSLTIEAIEIAGLDYSDHQEFMGYRVDKIANAIDGEDGLWLLYWEDGVLARLAVDANSIDDDAIIMWRFE